MNRYEFVIDGETYVVAVESVGVRDASVVVNGVQYEVEITKGVEAAPVVRSSAAHQIAAAAPAARSTAAPSPAGGGSGTITAPLPGLILSVPVSVGDTVAPGDVVVRMEAMKMENDVKTAVAGVVKEVRTKKDAEVQVGEVLVVIEPS